MKHRLVLASTSPQRRTILEQLAIPFDAVAPRYVEHDPPDADPVALVRDHALGKARSVHEAGRTTLRRRGREDERLRHEGFAATQISSAGHFRAHSAENAA